MLNVIKYHLFAFIEILLIISRFNFSVVKEKLNFEFNFIK